jgi:hypothetical protein
VFVLPSQDDLRRSLLTWFISFSVYCFWNESYILFWWNLFCSGWHGVIFLRAGLYKNAVFKFIILIPDDVPSYFFQSISKY